MLTNGYIESPTTLATKGIHAGVSIWKQALIADRHTCVLMETVVLVGLILIRNKSVVIISTINVDDVA